MNKTKKRLLSVIASGAMLLHSAVPLAFAAEYNFEISGNGADSNNDIQFDNDQNTEVFQDNYANVVNEINVNSNTGGNDIEDNTGGDISLQTGDITIGASVNNQLNSNVAEVNPCDCDTNVTAVISGNGVGDEEDNDGYNQWGHYGGGWNSGSENKIDIDNDQDILIKQDNVTKVINKLDLDADTGNNDIEDNTGGSISLLTGNITINPVEVKNLAGSNFAVVGGGDGEGGSSLNLEISGNGADSDNDIEADVDSDIHFFQDNWASIYNHLDIDADTGNNDIEDNTLWHGHHHWFGWDDDMDDDLDGDAQISLTTGNIDVAAAIDNAAGFNVASSDCGCVLIVNGKVHGNGSDSDNKLDLDIDDDLKNVQDNVDYLHNLADSDSDTGDNDVEDNTKGGVTAETGASSTVINASNSGGFNVFGDLQVELPWGWSFFFGDDEGGEA